MSDFARVMEMAIEYGAQPGPVKQGEIDNGPLFGRDPQPAPTPTPAEMPKTFPTTPPESHADPAQRTTAATARTR